MGLVAFAVLMSFEFTVAIFGFGRSPAQFLTALGSTPGAIGLAAQIAFAFIPVLQAKGMQAPARGRA